MSDDASYDLDDFDDSFDSDAECVCDESCDLDECECECHDDDSALDDFVVSDSDEEVAEIALREVKKIMSASKCRGRTLNWQR